MTLLLSFCLLSLSSCGEERSVEEIAIDAVVKAAVKQLTARFDTSKPPMETYELWAYWSANAAGFFLVVGLLMLWLCADKSRGGRMMLMGVSFAILAKVIEVTGNWIDKWTGMILFFGLPIFLIIVFVIYVKQVEKFLCKLGWCVDLNRDGMIGTSAIENTDSETADVFDGDDTDRIENKADQ